MLNLNDNYHFMLYLENACDQGRSEKILTQGKICDWAFL